MYLGISNSNSSVSFFLSLLFENVKKNGKNVNFFFELMWVLDYFFEKKRVGFLMNGLGFELGRSFSGLNILFKGVFCAFEVKFNKVGFLNF